MPACVPSTIVLGSAWMSVGRQSNAFAGTLSVIGASKGQFHVAGIGRRSTSISPPFRPASLSKAYCHLAPATGVFGPLSGTGSANSNGPYETVS